mmetsp:Transcript_13846/g.41861  ORF Transcript_13846/g.41861 Transcript_13846/m.41861 type:complete len:209 (+) Transcript_13846:889-1515(+)
MCHGLRPLLSLRRQHRRLVQLQVVLSVLSLFHAVGDAVAVRRFQVPTAPRPPLRPRRGPVLVRSLHSLRHRHGALPRPAHRRQSDHERTHQPAPLRLLPRPRRHPDGRPRALQESLQQGLHLERHRQVLPSRPRAPPPRPPDLRLQRPRFGFFVAASPSRRGHPTLLLPHELSLLLLWAPLALHLRRSFFFERWSWRRRREAPSLGVS